MPIYEYKALGGGCDHCREAFSVLRRMSDEPLAKCPRCGAKVERMFSTFAVSSDKLAPSRLKEHGFTKLKRRDKGVYEDVTS